MHITLAQFISLIVKYKYLILFPLFVVEGPVSTIIAGFLATPEMNYLNILPLAFLAVAADLTGDIFYYSIGRWGRGSILFMKLAARWGLNPNRLSDLDEHFKNHGGKTIAIGKISHGIGWSAMLVAGVAHMRLTKFFGVNFLVSLGKTALLLALGYYYGESYQALGSYLHYGGLIFSAVLVAAIIIYFLWKRSRSIPPSASS